MNSWVIIILVVDVAFMVGIMFMLISYKKSRPIFSTELAIEGGMPPSYAEFDTEVMEKLKEELVVARSITEKLGKKQNELEDLELSLMSNKRAMDKLIKEASVEPRIKQRKWNDTYAEATYMLDNGADVDEVIDKFDLLSGEAELITSLNNLRN